MEGVTFIKGLFYFMLKANAAVGEIHHWASGDYKKDVHGWKKVKKQAYLLNNQQLKQIVAY
jgi:hypothetical protein